MNVEIWNSIKSDLRNNRSSKETINIFVESTSETQRGNTTRNVYYCKGK